MYRSFSSIHCSDVFLFIVEYLNQYLGTKNAWCKKILSLWLILIYFVYDFAFLCKIRENEIANLQFHRKHYIRFSDWDIFKENEDLNFKITKKIVFASPITTKLCLIDFLPRMFETPNRQPTLWLHDLCLEVLTVHGNKHLIYITCF